MLVKDDNLTSLLEKLSLETSDNGSESPPAVPKDENENEFAAPKSELIVEKGPDRHRFKSNVSPYPKVGSTKLPDDGQNEQWLDAILNDSDAILNDSDSLPGADFLEMMTRESFYAIDEKLRTFESDSDNDDLSLPSPGVSIGSADTGIFSSTSSPRTSGCSPFGTDDSSSLPLTIRNDDTSDDDAYRTPPRRSDPIPYANVSSRPKKIEKKYPILMPNGPVRDRNPSKALLEAKMRKDKQKQVWIRVSDMSVSELIERIDGETLLVRVLKKRNEYKLETIVAIVERLKTENRLVCDTRDHEKGYLYNAIVHCADEPLVARYVAESMAEAGIDVGEKYKGRTLADFIAYKHGDKYDVVCKEIFSRTDAFQIPNIERHYASHRIYNI